MTRELQCRVLRSMLRVGIGPTDDAPLFIGPPIRETLSINGETFPIGKCAVSWAEGNTVIGGMIAVPA